MNQATRSRGGRYCLCAALIILAAGRGAPVLAAGRALDRASQPGEAADRQARVRDRGHRDPAAVVPRWRPALSSRL